MATPSADSMAALPRRISRTSPTGIPVPLIAHHRNRKLPTRIGPGTRATQTEMAEDVRARRVHADAVIAEPPLHWHHQQWRTLCSPGRSGAPLGANECSTRRDDSVEVVLEQIATTPDVGCSRYSLPTDRQGSASSRWTAAEIARADPASSPKGFSTTRRAISGRREPTSAVVRSPKIDGVALHVVGIDFLRCGRIVFRHLFTELGDRAIGSPDRDDRDVESTVAVQVVTATEATHIAGRNATHRDP